MKKIINGKVYDTESAKLIGEWDNGRYGRDFGMCTEDLYQKRTGEFFLHGCGGPMSKYAVSHGDNDWSGGEKVIPLSYDAAREWSESHLPAEEYEAIFGDVIEDGSRMTVTLSLSASAVERAKRAAAQAKMSLSAYVESKL